MPMYDFVIHKIVLKSIEKKKFWLPVDKAQLVPENPVVHTQVYWLLKLPLKLLLLLKLL